MSSCGFKSTWQFPRRTVFKHLICIPVFNRTSVSISSHREWARHAAAFAAPDAVGVNEGLGLVTSKGHRGVLVRATAIYQSSPSCPVAKQSQAVSIRAARRLFVYQEMWFIRGGRRWSAVWGRGGFSGPDGWRAAGTLTGVAPWADKTSRGLILRCNSE